MAYDEVLAERIRDHIGPAPGIEEKKMFGGLSFLLNGNLACGVIGEEICVRVGLDGYEEALTQSVAREMDFTGRPMKGWVMVGADGISNANGLGAWVDRGIEFAGSLPAK